MPVIRRYLLYGKLLPNFGQWSLECLQLQNSHHQVKPMQYVYKAEDFIEGLSITMGNKRPFDCPFQTAFYNLQYAKCNSIGLLVLFAFI